MSNTEIWAAPKSDAMLGAYRIEGDKLSSCGAVHDASQDDSALQTLSVWHASQKLPGAALLVVKSDKATSLGVRNGGLIIEGRDKLNIGMMCASTRTLAPAELSEDIEPALTSDDRFRRAFWATICRLQSTVLPRCFQFYLDGVEGKVHISNGELRFTGDFLNPANFVEELRAACEVGEGIKYTLLDDTTQPDVPAFAVSDLIAHVAKQSDDESYRFAADGWPIECAELQSVDLILSLSGIAAASSRMKQHSTPLSVMVLSAENSTLVRGQTQEDGAMQFRLS